MHRPTLKYAAYETLALEFSAALAAASAIGLEFPVPEKDQAAAGADKHSGIRKHRRS